MHRSLSSAVCLNLLTSNLVEISIKLLVRTNLAHGARDKKEFSHRAGREVTMMNSPYGMVLLKLVGEFVEYVILVSCKSEVHFW